MESHLLPVTYAVYLVISVAMTVWVARTLFNHGRPFLVDAFRGNEVLADSVNHLLVVGFYLVNLGYVSLMLQSSHQVATVAQSLEVLSSKIGWVLLVLGLVHFANVIGISRLRRSGLLERWVGEAPEAQPLS